MTPNLPALAQRLESAAKLRDAAAAAHSPLDDESDHLRVERLIQSAHDLREAAKCAMAIHDAKTWAAVTGLSKSGPSSYSVAYNSGLVDAAMLIVKKVKAFTALDAIEAVKPGDAR